LVKGISPKKMPSHEKGTGVVFIMEADVQPMRMEAGMDPLL
jgi:hypothetical protein